MTTRQPYISALAGSPCIGYVPGRADFGFLLALVGRHPRAAQKIGVPAFVVGSAFLL